MPVQAPLRVLASEDLPFSFSRWIFPVVTVIGLLFVPTSPAFLVKRGRPAEAAKVISRLYGSQDENFIRARLAVIQHTVAMEQHQASQIGSAKLLDLFRDPIDRRRTFLTIGVWICYNMAGAAFLGSGLYFLQQQVNYWKHRGDERRLMVFFCRVSISLSPLKSPLACSHLVLSPISSPPTVCRSSAVASVSSTPSKY